MMLLPLLITLRDLLIIAAFATLIIILLAVAWSSRQPRSSLREQTYALLRLPLVVLLAIVPATVAAVGLWLSLTFAGLVLQPTPTRPAVTAPAKPRETPAVYRSVT